MIKPKVLWPLSLSLFSLIILNFNGLAHSDYRGVTLDRSGAIYVIDPITDTAEGPFLQGMYAQLQDILALPNGGTFVASAFQDAKLIFLKMVGNDVEVKSEVDFTSVPSSDDPFNPADLAITPDGKSILATDGASLDCAYDVDRGVASVNTQTRTLAHYFPFRRPSKPRVYPLISIEIYTREMLATRNYTSWVLIHQQGISTKEGSNTTLHLAD